MSDPRDDKERGRNAAALALVGQLGFVVVTPVVVGAMAGVYLDERWGNDGWAVIGGVLIGVASGVAGAYRVVKPYLK